MFRCKGSPLPFLAVRAGKQEGRKILRVSVIPTADEKGLDRQEEKVRAHKYEEEEEEESLLSGYEEEEEEEGAITGGRER